MKAFLIAIAIFLSVLTGFAQQTIPLANWKFATGDNPEWAKPGFDDSGWKPIKVGEYWEADGYAGLDGYAWYRVRFVLPSTLKKNTFFNDSIVLSLGNIDDLDQTFINGELIGQNAVNWNAAKKEGVPVLDTIGPGCGKARNYTLPVNAPCLLWDKENTIAVRVYDLDYGGGMRSMPIQIRMKDLGDFLEFDTRSKPLEMKAGRLFSKTMILKNLSPVSPVNGTLTTVVSYVDEGKIIVQKSAKTVLDKQGFSFSINFKADPLKRVKINYRFTEAGTGSVSEANYILPYRIANRPDDDAKGVYYDYTKTLAPERPYILEYDRMPRFFSYNSEPDQKGGSRVYETFEQTMKRIIETDNITRGIPKIWQLIGWQYNGHDDRYPAFFEVNDALKRPQDSTGRQSFLWLQDEAAKYNTRITVHINITDAYADSPLWDTYVENDLIARSEDGTRYQTGVWNNRPAYQVCYTREWDAGFAQKRIDSLINLLQLQKSGTVHIDAFMARDSKYHGITREMETETMRKIFRYWRDKGIDVTSECQAFNRTDPFFGLQPWAGWFDLTRDQRAALPHSLVYGGGFGPPWLGTDEQYCLKTAFLFCGGASASECVNVTQQYYQNSRKLLSYNKDNNTTTYEGGLVIDANNWTVKENRRLLREADDAFIPALWQKSKEIIAFSKNGYTSKEWVLPPDWSTVRAVDIYSVTKDGIALKTKNVPVAAGRITLSLQPLEEVSVQPVKD